MLQSGKTTGAHHGQNTGGESIQAARKNKKKEKEKRSQTIKTLHGRSEKGFALLQTIPDQTPHRSVSFHYISFHFSHVLAFDGKSWRVLEEKLSVPRGHSSAVLVPAEHIGC